MASETFNLNGKAFAFGIGPIGKNRRFNGTVFSFAPEDKGRITKIIEVRAGANSLSQSLLQQGIGYTFNGTSVRLVNGGVNYLRIEFEREWLPKFKNNLDGKKGNYTLSTDSKKSNVKNKALGTIKSEGLKNIFDKL